ncbi:hypothetical protein B0H67DRAFT_648894 [Lasiosphaeris hirsuta]|uniref:Uncharacterized protein n=1 Tax=Lasiosphaeris hirsuta TaxID=260670 RepID=A0AA39ZVS5_9PEZI|nr:hypothetical protein B0H67DRAFT_648894 [Lasiosphaeris hirsuta]
MPSLMSSRDKPSAALETVQAKPIKLAREHRAAPAWQTSQEAARKEAGISLDKATGSLSPIPNPEALNEGGFGHDMVKEVFGETYKWQQVALGVSVGIPVDEWDGAVHTESSQFVAYGDGYSDALSKRHAARSAGRTFGSAAWIRLRDTWPQIVDCAKRLTTARQTIYDFLATHSITCEVVKLAAGSAGEGANQAAAFVQSLLEDASAGDQSAARADINLPNGHTLSVMDETFDTKDKPSRPMSELCLALLFVTGILLNAGVRLFLWPRIESLVRLYAPLAVAVVATRIPIAVLTVRLHQRILGEKWLAEPLSSAVIFAPTILVDLVLGSCYFSCGILSRGGITVMLGGGTLFGE